MPDERETPQQWRARMLYRVTRSREFALEWLERVGSWPSEDPDVQAVTRAAERSAKRYP